MFKKKYLVLFLIIFLAAFLRLYKLDQIPAALYWDEVSLGYNAYSILTTGHDEHGEKLPITRFIAFGDYKPPGYIYAAVPALAIFGVSEIAVRFPSALAGILMVVTVYFLVIKLTKNARVGLLASLMLAISPWSLQLSRAAFEANLAALFNLLAITVFIFSQDKKWLLPISLIFFMASFYTFNANRIIAPLLICLLIILYWRNLWSAKKWVVVSMLIGLVLIWPNVSYFQTRESKLRFEEVSIFNNLDIIIKSNQRIARYNNALWARLLYNRRVYFAQEFLIHYLDHFRADYLFIKGDRNPRLSTQDVGELYLFELPFLLVGLYWLLRTKNRISGLILGWLLIAPIPAGMARETPHMLRTASMLPTYQIITGIGLVGIFNWLKQQKSVVRSGIILCYAGLILGSLVYYFQNYYVHYPRDWAGEWQYGYKQMVKKVTQLEVDYDRIVVTKKLGRPYIYFLFYNQVNPLEYLKIRRADRDWYGFWDVDGFGKYDFINEPKNEGEKVLMVVTPEDFDETWIKLDEIRDLGGKEVFVIGKS